MSTSPVPIAPSGSATAASVSASPDLVDIINVAEEVAVAPNNKVTSWVWGYLTRVTSTEQAGPKCNLCSQIINYGKSKSTSTLVST